MTTTFPAVNSPKAPASQHLRQAAASLAVEPDGSFFFACGPGAYLNGSWQGFGRFDAATRKVTKVEAPMEGPIALLGPDLVGVAKRTQLTVVDRQTGAVKRTFAPVEFEVEELLASPDGKWLVSMRGNGSSAVLFDAKGKATSIPALAVAFTGPDELFFNTFEGEQGLLVRRNLVTGKEKRTKWEAESLYGALRLRDGKVLSTVGGLLDLSTRRYVDLGSGIFCWGAEPNTVLRIANVGQVEVLDLEGKVLRSFARPRRGSIIEAYVVEGTLVVTTGTYLELYQLGGKQPAKATPRKAPAARKPVTSAASGDARSAKLLEAFFAKPEDQSRLAVWADLLAELGDPRGEFIQLHLIPKPTKEQYARMTQLQKNGGPMVGPAREFLRSWEFGENGLVEKVVCEADLLAAGFESIASLNPGLSVRVTALSKKTAARVAALAALKLGRVPIWCFNQNSLSDESFSKLASALRGARELDLTGNAITAEGLTKVLPHLKGLTDLQVDEPVLEAPGFRKTLLAALPTLKFLNQQHAR